MTQLTMVHHNLVDEWVADAAQLIAGQVVPLSDIYNSINSEDPQYFWKQTTSNRYTRRWVIAYKNSGDPVLVGSAGRIKECASRPHGNYIPNDQPIPGEYNSIKIYRGDLREAFRAQQFWWIMNNDSYRPHLGTYMKGLETALEPLLANTFEGNHSIEELRSYWTQPQNSGVHKLEHPLLCSRNERTDRLTTLADEDQLPAHEWITDLEQKCGNTYVITPGRPQVLSKRGAHSDPEVAPVLAETDEDFHRPDDIVWFSGEIHAKANRVSYLGSAIGWSTTWRPESVVRVARVLRPPPPQGGPESPRKRRRMNPEDFPSPIRVRRMNTTTRTAAGTTSMANGSCLFSSGPTFP